MCHEYDTMFSDIGEYFTANHLYTTLPQPFAHIYLGDLYIDSILKF